MAFVLRLPKVIYDDMLRHAAAETPNECVGLLAGNRDGVVIERYPLINALASPRRFESDAHSMFAAEKRRRDAGLEFLAIYHSHPTSPAVPSKIDLENNYCEDIMCVIISLLPPAPVVKAYWLTATKYTLADYQIAD